MNYADTLFVHLNGYPTLYEEESQVLHHLFFVNGNGHEWVGGELRDIDRDEDRSPEEIVRAILEETRARIQHMKDSYDWSLIGPEAVRHLDEHLGALGGDDYVGWAHEQSKRKRDEKIYPLCEYACIVNLPDDIKPDWLEAAKRALKVAEKLQKTEEDSVWLRRAEKRIRRLEAQ